MQKTFAKKPSNKELLAKRLLVIDLYKAHTPVMQIVKKSGLSWPAVNKAIKLYEVGGSSTLELKQRGRKQGKGRALTQEQEIELRKILYRKRPWQVGLKHATRTIKLSLWNREAVCKLIENQCGASLSVRGIAKYLQRWGFPLTQHHQRPIDRCTVEIQEWTHNHNESIYQHVPSEVFWIAKRRMVIDKNELSTKENGWPRVLSMISAIDTHGKEHWIIVSGNFTQEKQINFLKALTTQSLGKCICVRNSSNYFMNQNIRDWLYENADKTSVLPPLLPNEIKE